MKAIHDGKAKNEKIDAHKLARAVYYMLTREPAFALQRFVSASPLRGEREPAVSLAHSGQSPRDVPSLSIQRGLCEEHLDQSPEPQAVIGLSLSLICLVLRHQGPRGCPSAESGTHEECLRTQPAALKRLGRGHRRISRVQCLRALLFSYPRIREHRPSRGVWCSPRL